MNRLIERRVQITRSRVKAQCLESQCLESLGDLIKIAKYELACGQELNTATSIDTLAQIRATVEGL